jgi:hypothetical protein
MDIDLTLRAKEFASKDPFPMKGFGPEYPTISIPKRERNAWADMNALPTHHSMGPNPFMGNGSFDANSFARRVRSMSMDPPRMVVLP